MNYKKHLHVGPGGIDCSCCFDAPGSDGRKKAFRKAKRTERDFAMKEALEELLEVEESPEDDYIFMDHD